jgi:anaerobic ribonucleoside-triphosphate reductase activating protein
VRIRIARLHAPVTALGPGTRIGIWLQGCTIGCRGCISQDTWAVTDAALTDVDDVLAFIASHADDRSTDPIAGLTITGGEPSEQPEALAALLDGVARRRRHDGWDVLCYTGVEEDEFARRCPDAYSTVDVLVTGPYQVDRPTDLIWRGSANQRMVLLTELGLDRYSRYVDATTQRPPLQVQLDGDGFFLIGVPRTGDRARLRRRLAARGIELDQVSWRPDRRDGSPPST